MTIDQLTPSTIPEKGMVRVSGTITNNDTVPWSTINVYAFISDDAADDRRPARQGSGHPRGRRGRRPDHRRAAQVQHRGAGAGRPRDVQPQHPAQAAPGATPPGSTGSACTRSARGRRAATWPPTAGPAPSCRWSRPARPGQQPDGRGDPAAPPARLHRRGLARRPLQLDPDPLPGRSAPLARRLRGQLRRPHRDLGRRPRAHRRRTSTGGRQPAQIAGGQPGGRPGRRRGRGVRRPLCEHHPDRAAHRDPDGGARERRRQPARPRRARPGRPGGRPGRAGLAGQVGRRDAPRGPGHVAAVRRRRRGRRARRTTRSSTSAPSPGPARRCRASTSPPPRCCPRRAAT